jgi:hypothetical protein
MDAVALAAGVGGTSRGQRSRGHALPAQRREAGAMPARGSAAGFPGLCDAAGPGFLF